LFESQNDFKDLQDKQLDEDPEIRGKSAVLIEVERVDSSARGSVCKAEGNDEAQAFGKPYEKTIEYFKLTLTKKMAPIDKLLCLQKGWQILFDEIHDYQTRRVEFIKQESVGQEQRDYILRYVLLKTEVQDLYAQRMLIEEFTGKYIQEGSNELSKLYIEFTAAVDWLANLDGNQLASAEKGRGYLKDFNLLTLNDRMY